MKKKLFFAVFAIFMCVMVAGCSKTLKLNDTATIETDKIKLTVLESQKTTVDKGTGSLLNGDYVKVKVTIENYGTEAYSWGLLNFSLGGDAPSLKALTMEDYIPDKIEAGQSATGYLYFDDTDSKEFMYTSAVEGTGGSKAKAERATFNLG